MPFDGVAGYRTRNDDSLRLESAMLRIADRRDWCRFAMTRRRWFSHKEQHCMLGALFAEYGQACVPVRVMRVLAQTIDPYSVNYGQTIADFNDGNMRRWSKHADVMRVMQTAIERLRRVNTRWSQFS